MSDVIMSQLKDHRLINYPYLLHGTMLMKILGTILIKIQTSLIRGKVVYKMNSAGCNVEINCQVEKICICIKCFS